MVGLLVAIYGPLTDLAGGSAIQDIDDAEKRAAGINAVRQTLLATAAGAAAFVGLAFTTRKFYMSRRGQLMDRYTKAITQLASDKLEERLGGIYALEHLMRESPRDHVRVIEVLAAFIREKAPSTTFSVAAVPPADSVPLAEQYHLVTRPAPATDVQVASIILST